MQLISQPMDTPGVDLSSGGDPLTKTTLIKTTTKNYMEHELQFFQPYIIQYDKWEDAKKQKEVKKTNLTLR